MVNSNQVVEGDLVIFGEGSIKKLQDFLLSDPPPFFLIDIDASKKQDDNGALARRAFDFMNQGAMDCLTSDLTREEIRGVVDHVLIRQQRNKVSWSKPVAMAAGVLALVTGLFFFRNFGPKSHEEANQPVNEAQTFFQILLMNPTGIATNNDQLWVSDWVTQSITSYRIGTHLAVIQEYVMDDFSPVSLCASENFLWSLSNEAVLRAHSLDGALSVKKIFKLNRNVTGLSWEDGYLWTYDLDKKEVLKIDPATGEPASGSFAIPVKNPVGLVIHGRKMWIMDDENSTVYTFAQSGKIWNLEKTFFLPQFSPDRNKPLGFGGDGRHVWISSEKSGVLCRLATDKI
jgi:hypothetical protein